MPKTLPMQCLPGPGDIRRLEVRGNRLWERDVNSIGRFLAWGMLQSLAGKTACPMPKTLPIIALDAKHPKGLRLIVHLHRRCAFSCSLCAKWAFLIRLRRGNPKGIRLWLAQELPLRPKLIASAIHGTGGQPCALLTRSMAPRCFGTGKNGSGFKGCYQIGRPPWSSTWRGRCPFCKHHDRLISVEGLPMFWPLIKLGRHLNGVFSRLFCE